MAIRSSSVLAAAVALAGCGALDVKPVDPAPPAPAPDAFDIRTTDHRDQPFDLRGAIAERPTVLVFYRGHW